MTTMATRVGRENKLNGSSESTKAIAALGRMGHWNAREERYRFGHYKVCCHFDILLAVCCRDCLDLALSQKETTHVGKSPFQYAI